jgi:predicted O-methyltransferase YrrM
MPAQPTDLVDSIASGYRDTQILLTANRLGLFSALTEGARSSDQLAVTLEADRRGTRILCDALVALELLKKNDGRYALTAVAREFLLADSPRSKQALLHHIARLYERWAKLYDAVKSGKPVPDEVIDPRLQGGAHGFARAMADVARESAELTCDKLDLSGVGTLLDVGGGPGLYALTFARRFPTLHAVVFDEAETLEVTRANIEEHGLGKRVSVLEGDCFRDDLGGPYDFVFLSNLVHIYAAEANRDLIARCAAVLNPGGRVAIKDFLTDPDRTSPAGGALFAVNMLVGTDGGDCYTTKETRGWLENAGLAYMELVELTAQSRIIVGRKPEA